MAQSTTVAILGAGYLGMNIGFELALCGINVHFYDVKEFSSDQVRRKVFSVIQPLIRLNYVCSNAVEEVCKKIFFFTSLEESMKDVSLVIEALTDDIFVKENVLVQVEKISSLSTILVSNSLRIPLNAIEQKLRRPENFAGVRFLSPVLGVNKVEFTLGTKTSKETVSRLNEFFKSINKTYFEGPKGAKLSPFEVTMLREGIDTDR